MKNYLVGFIFIIVSNLVGSIGSLFTSPKIQSWYANINKPSFNPPNWIFGPVWTLLFSLLGIAFYLVVKNGVNKPGVKLAIIIFGVQFIFNILWSYLFFGLEKPLLALIDLVLLLISIFVMTFVFYRINHISAYLIIPYILWVSFAGVLNFYIWRLN